MTKNTPNNRDNTINSHFDKIRSIIAKYKVMFAGLSMFALSNIYSNDVNKVYDETKFSVSETLNKSFSLNLPTSKQEQVKKIFEDITKKHPNIDPNSNEYQLMLYTEIKAIKDITGIQILQAFILGLLYAYAYFQTLRNVKNNKMPIDPKSFLTFSLTSGGMVMVNGLIPGSAVYLESFLLAGYTVYLHLRNENEKLIIEAELQNNKLKL